MLEEILAYSFFNDWFICNCIGACLNVCLYKSVGSLGTGVIDRYELLCGCWELNLGPLVEQPLVLLTAESSVQCPWRIILTTYRFYKILFLVMGWYMWTAENNSCGSLLSTFTVWVLGTECMWSTLVANTAIHWVTLLALSSTKWTLDTFRAERRKRINIKKSNTLTKILC